MVDDIQKLIAEVDTIYPLFILYFIMFIISCFQLISVFANFTLYIILVSMSCFACTCMLSIILITVFILTFSSFAICLKLFICFNFSCMCCLTLFDILLCFSTSLICDVIVLLQCLHLYLCFFRCNITFFSLI